MSNHSTLTKGSLVNSKVIQIWNHYLSYYFYSQMLKWFRLLAWHLLAEIIQNSALPDMPWNNAAMSKYQFLVLNAGKVKPYPSQPNQVIGWDIVLVGCTCIKCRLSLLSLQWWNCSKIERNIFTEWCRNWSRGVFFS